MGNSHVTDMGDSHVTNIGDNQVTNIDECKTPNMPESIFNNTSEMKVRVIKTGLDQIQPLRISFLQENNFQFIHNKCHSYGWADTYLFLMDEINVGCGAVWGQNKREDRDAIFEFSLIKPFRKFSNLIFPEFQSTHSQVAAHM